MASVAWSPFKHGLDDLEGADLAVLREVAEGWYVEYKQSPVATKKVGKSLAAFANHYGGWLFYGVKQTADGTNRAGSFPGLGDRELMQIIERLRNAAKDCIAPAPYYEPKVVQGPCAELSLDSGKAIVVVRIPSGPNTPYVHVDGKIYRRIADSSDPKPITDRFTLDELWKRGVQARDRVRQVLSRTPVTSKGEENTSYLEVFFLLDPLAAREQRSQLEFGRFVEVMKDRQIEGVRNVCDNFFTMPGGMVARQVGMSDAYGLTYVWKHLDNGSSIVTVPIPSSNVRSQELSGWLSGYKHSEGFLRALSTSGNVESWILDINLVIAMLVAAFGRQRDLMTEGQVDDPLYVKVALHNMWRRVPFLDTRGYTEFVSEHGIPVIQFDDDFAPPGDTFESLHLVVAKPTRGVNQQWIEAAFVFTWVLNGLGLPIATAFREGMDDDDNWLQVVTRANKVGELRSRSARLAERYGRSTC